MTFSFFNLPANILSNIYEMDPTYRDIFRDEINYDIWVNSFDKFRRNFITDPRFDGELNVSRKFDTLLRYLFEYEVSGYNQSVIKGMVPDQITIYTDWNENGNTDNEGLYARIFSSQIFEGNVYTIDQYNLKYDPEIQNYDEVFRDDEFVIVQRSYDSYYDDDDNDWWWDEFPI